MDGRIKRRSFLKHLFSLSAFSSGVLFPFMGNRGVWTGRYRPVNGGFSEAHAGDAGPRIKKIAIEEHIYAPKVLDTGTVDQIDNRLKDAVQFIDSSPLSDGEKEKICHGNAERLLRL